MQNSAKSIQRLRESFQIHPLWKFLETQYSLEDSFSFFGPYQGACVIPQMIDDYNIKVSMPLKANNINYVGTQFGGSLYSMCDPFYMLLLMKLLGEEYMVWDKSASIEFLRPGATEVHALFSISEKEIDEIKAVIGKEKKTTRFYEVNVLDTSNQVVAKVRKELYIRRMPK